jgi:hypothetical protein
MTMLRLPRRRFDGALPVSIAVVAALGGDTRRVRHSYRELARACSHLSHRTSPLSLILNF